MLGGKANCENAARAGGCVGTVLTLRSHLASTLPLLWPPSATGPPLVPLSFPLQVSSICTKFCIAAVVGRMMYKDPKTSLSPTVQRICQLDRFFLFRFSRYSKKSSKNSTLNAQSSQTTKVKLRVGIISMTKIRNRKAPSPVQSQPVQMRDPGNAERLAR